MNIVEYPFISVIIPTLNRGEFIKKNIDCVLSQTYQNFEIIVVDDGSEDNTKEIINSIEDNRIKYIKHPKNLGAAAARNTGIKAACGKWIAFLDSDDIWDKTKLEKQAKVIPELTDDYAVVHCGLQYVDYTSGNNLTKRMSIGNINELVKKNLGIVPQTSTMVIRKDALLAVGLFDENLPAHQEAELGLRIAQNYKFRLIEETLVIVARNHKQIRGNPQLYIKAKEIIVENYKNILSKELLYDYCNIIAGDSIIKKDFSKAKKYLHQALGHRFKLKSVLSYLMISILPKLSAFIYTKKYKRKGFIK
ncbi:MAG TPA: glycosyltransferase family 2 protein [Ignavibacteriaceae bacterium]|nr:glycosyltransferase family 2 protein [Ignavibacteriaceae bacterium]